MASYEQAKALLQGSVSRQTLYTLNIYDNPSTPAEKKITREEKDYIRMFATKVRMPGVATDQVTSIGQEYMGIQRNTAAGIKFGDNQLIINVIENSQFSAYDMMRRIFSNMGVNTNPLGKNGGRAQRMRYYNDYVFDIKLTKLEFPYGSRIFQNARFPDDNDVDHGYKIVSRYRFEKCYIQNIGEILLDSNATDGYVEFEVRFAYESYYHNNTKTMDVEFKDD